MNHKLIVALFCILLFNDLAAQDEDFDYAFLNPGISKIRFVYLMGTSCLSGIVPLTSEF